MIEFRDVTKRYPGHGTALEAVSFRIEEGQLAFVTGPSGAGKSTLLRLVHAAEQPTLGEVEVGGRNIGRIHPRSVPFLRRNMGVVFQDFKLLPRRTAAENVALALEVVGTPRGELNERVREALGRVGLEGRGKRLPGELSGGEQQRVAIARAIVNKPAIVLADEPTGNLDQTRARGIFELLAGLAAEDGTTVLVATHDLPEAERWGLRRIHLEDGRLVSDSVTAPTRATEGEEEPGPRGEEERGAPEPPAATDTDRRVAEEMARLPPDLSADATADEPPAPADAPVLESAATERFAAPSAPPAPLARSESAPPSALDVPEPDDLVPASPHSSPQEDR